MLTRVCLVGTCPSSRLLAPYGDPGWLIWACSPDNAGMLPRVDRWFEIHSDLGLSGAEGWEAPYLDWIGKQSFEIVHNEAVSLFSAHPRAMALPHEDLIRRFTPYFFTSTPAWMMAMALVEGAKEIALYGIDMATKHEYAIQRPAMQHMIYVAEREFGASVICPLESDLIQPPPLYGFSLTTPMGRKLAVRRKEIEDRLAGIAKARAAIDAEDMALKGSLDDLDYMQQTWTGMREPALNVPTRMAGPKAVARGD